MEQSAQSRFIDESESTQAPFVYISSLKSFLAKKLLGFLLDQNCIVIAIGETELLEKKLPKGVSENRKFFLTQNIQEITEQNIKIQYAFIFLDKDEKNNYIDSIKKYLLDSAKIIYISQEEENYTTENITSNAILH